MGYILSVETSGTNCSVVLSNRNEVTFIKEENTGSFSHAEKLHVFIKEVMELGNVAPEDIDAIAVSKGPGSYTGLRIGVSTVKGLCFAWDKPMLSVSTLEALAYQAVAAEVMYIIPLIDARRMEVYSAVFTNAMEPVRVVEAEVIDETSFLTYLEKGKVLFLGDGAQKCKSVISHANAVFVDNKFPSAKEVGQLAFQKYQKNDFENIAYFEPFYLKDFVTGKKAN
ncbi:tRNA (adenosine(37)-N6)-threonylcarbamoyltransferase complex dimerization subunit type 1 TsaB [Neptunitalea chrysea]|nr:tRNA (adenosine(37)-N6)-threonylcarbamoyltransferase complex dimerization subunit type 1 TsaB [Neptunitalea chrysea]